MRSGNVADKDGIARKTFGNKMPNAEWEKRFQSWAQGPGKTESERCAKAERMVKESLKVTGILDKYRIEVFTQGSFANRTNIPQESDVDICIRSMRAFFPQYPEGLTASTFGNETADFTFAQFKDDVQNALRVRFGSDVKRGDKCFSLRENSYRVDADVTATLEHRRYNSAKVDDYYSGTAFNTDSGKRIINWPKQHIENGNAKHGRTKDQFKKIVRMLKRLQFDLIDNSVIAKKLVPSYAIECCVFNLSDASLSAVIDRYAQVRNVIIGIFAATKDDESCKEWVEVNHLKWLFRPGQPWTRDDVRELMRAAWRHVGFE